MGAVSLREDILERFLEDVREGNAELNARVASVEVASIEEADRSSWMARVYARLVKQTERLVEIMKSPGLSTPSHVLSLEWDNHGLKKELTRSQKEIDRLKGIIATRNAEHERNQLRLSRELRTAMNEIARLRREVKDKNAAIATFKTTGRVFIAPRGHKKKTPRRASRRKGAR